MPAPILKKTILAIALAIVILALIVTSLPLIASTQIVRTRIAQELSEWSGYRVSIDAAPELDVWPSFKAVLSDVSFWSWSAGRPPVLTAERVEINLSALSAIAGGIVFSKVHMTRPVLGVFHRGDFVYLPDSPGGGRFYEALSKLQAGTTPADEAFGSISFSDGTIVEVDGDTTLDVVSGLTGAIDWPGMARPAALNANGMWRGEPVGLAMFVEAPAAFLAGKPSPIRTSLQAAPLTATFSGTAQFGTQLALDGSLEASSPSLRRTLEWSKADIAPGAAIGAVSVRGDIDGGLDRFKIDNAVISLGGNSGVGALELSLAGSVPTIAGTLAFDTLDIGSFLAAFATPGDADGGEPPVFDIAFTDQISLDLRLSAARAAAGPAAMTDVAATVQVRSGLAAFDISDATAFGGTVQAGFRVDRRPDGPMAEIRISASEVDWGGAAAAFGWQSKIPKVRGSLSAVLRGPVTDRAQLLYRLSGTVSGKYGAGTIYGIDLATLLARAPDAGFFPLSDTANGSVAIEAAEFKATLLGGAARLDNAVARTAREKITLGGVISYVGQSLALSATVEPRGEIADAPRHFFVGGSWNEPFLTPTLPVWSPE